MRRVVAARCPIPARFRQRAAEVRPDDDRDDDVERRPLAEHPAPSQSDQRRPSAKTRTARTHSCAAESGGLLPKTCASACSMSSNPVLLLRQFMAAAKVPLGWQPNAERVFGCRPGAKAAWPCRPSNGKSCPETPPPRARRGEGSRRRRQPLRNVVTGAFRGKSMAPRSRRARRRGHRPPPEGIPSPRARPCREDRHFS